MGAVFWELFWTPLRCTRTELGNYNVLTVRAITHSSLKDKSVAHYLNSSKF